MTPEDRVKEQARKLGGSWRMDPFQIPIVVLSTKAADNLIAQLDAQSDDDVEYEYKVVNVSLYTGLQEATNNFAKKGWRVVAVLGSIGPSYADQLIFERPVQ